jgi:hypothetical protein
LIDNSAEHGWLGVWHPVSSRSDVPAPTESVLVRAWLYGLSADSANDPRTTAQLAAHLYDSTAGRLDVHFSRSQFDAGQWSPLTLWAPATGFGPGDVWRPALFLRNDTWEDSPVRNRFLIAWEGFYQDTATVEGNGGPPLTPGDDETATIDGFALSDEWTMFLVTMVPFDQWDNRVGAGPNLTKSDAKPRLFSIEETGEGREVRLEADPKEEGFTFSLVSDQGTVSATVSDEVFWLRGSPVICLVRSQDGRLMLDYSIGGSIPDRLEIAGTLAPSAVRLGPDATVWKSVESLPYVLQDEDTAEVFRSISLLCLADFNRDAAVNTIDVIAFLNAWTHGDARADFNHDDVIDSRDVLAYLSAFAAGC